jgi:hypothetical protein
MYRPSGAILACRMPQREGANFTMLKHSQCPPGPRGDARNAPGTFPVHSRNTFGAFRRFSRTFGGVVASRIRHIRALRNGFRRGAPKLLPTLQRCRFWPAPGFVVLHGVRDLRKTPDVCGCVFSVAFHTPCILEFLWGVSQEGSICGRLA